MATDKAMVCGSDSEEDKDVDEANLPSREECESRCQMFAEVTGTDSALAMFYLQDRDWDLQVSLTSALLSLMPTSLNTSETELCIICVCVAISQPRYGRRKMYQNNGKKG